MAKTTIITTDDKEEKEEQVVVTKPSLTIDSGGLMNGADLDGDGHITEEEMAMHLEFKRRELEDADAMRCTTKNGMVCIIWYVTISICGCYRSWSWFRSSLQDSWRYGSNLLCISCSDCSSILWWSSYDKQEEIKL